MVDVVANADLDRIYTSQDFALGAETRDSMGRKFRFIKYNGGQLNAVDGVAGRLAIGLDAAYSFWEVTMDYVAAAETELTYRQMGFLQAALTDGDFGWIQTKGPNRKAMLTDDGVSQGDMLMKHATTDGAVDTHTGDVPILGVALENDNDTTHTLAAGYAEITIE